MEAPLKILATTAVLFFAMNAFSFETKCSRENVTALLTEASNFNRYSGKMHNRFMKLLNRNVGGADKDKNPGYSEIKEEYMAANSEKGTKDAKSIKVMDDIIKKNPECAEWSIFKY
jgi:hypothetical protein